MTTVLVTGANRGLGLEFVRQYLAEACSVIGVCRDPAAAEALRSLDEIHQALEVFEADMSDPSSIDALAGELGDRPIDILINNAGVFGPKRRADGDNRQTFGWIDYGIWLDVLRVNTLAPVKMAEALFDNVKNSSQKKIVTISSQLGSIAEGDAGLYAYRTSKAAINMGMATVSREAEAKDVIVVVLNPGWVKTDMGGDAATLSTEESIGSLRMRIAALSIEDSGTFIDHDGRQIPW